MNKAAAAGQLKSSNPFCNCLARSYTSLFLLLLLNIILFLTNISLVQYPTLARREREDKFAGFKQSSTKTAIWKALVPNVEFFQLPVATVANGTKQTAPPAAPVAATAGVAATSPPKSTTSDRKLQPATPIPLRLTPPVLTQELKETPQAGASQQVNASPGVPLSTPSGQLVTGQKVTGAPNPAATAGSRSETAAGKPSLPASVALSPPGAAAAVTVPLPPSAAAVAGGGAAAAAASTALTTMAAAPPSSVLPTSTSPAATGAASTANVAVSSAVTPAVTSAPGTTVAATRMAPTPSLSSPSTIHPGTFIYLVMGEVVPDDVHIKTSQLNPAVMRVIFLAWKSAPPTANVGNVHTAFFPGSTWATGRNRLIELALQQEMEQGWSFEYWVFMDSDARLILRESKTFFKPESTHMEAMQRVRDLLMRDRPARAGVSYPFSPQDIANHPMECVRNCANDAAVDIFHRTALNPVLPYPTKFDQMSWWMSSETTSYRSAAVFSDFCNTYREVVIDRRGNVHHPYTGQAGNVKFTNWKKMAVDAFQLCVATVQDAGNVWKLVEQHGIHRAWANDKVQCTTQKAGVDYDKLIKDPKLRDITNC